MIQKEKLEENIHIGHRERMREKILAGAADSFTDHEVLEFYLLGAYRQKDTNALAHSLISRFGSIKGVLDASSEELCSVPMVGKGGAAYLKGMSELMRRYFNAENKKQQFDKLDQVGDFFVHQFIGFGKENICVLLLDNAMCYIDSCMMNEGSVNSAKFDQTKLYQYAFGRNASNVIIAHNHPRGIAIPSEEDKNITSVLSVGLGHLGIKLVEHFVVADDRYTPIMRNSQFVSLKKISEEMLTFDEKEYITGIAREIK
ncbi:MAG: hypothetical protein IJZ89_06160 [Clostridia bacterium]|nr:hypothetical protein [Clostridia bacterium]